MRDFTKGSIGSGLFLFGLPIVAGNLFQQLYMFVNSAIVGRFLGDVDLAAVGAVYPIVFFFVSLIIGIGSAGGIVISHLFGARRHDCLPIAISTFYIFSLVVGVVVCSLGIVLARFTFEHLGLSPEVCSAATAYMRVYMLGMFFSFCFNSLVSVLRGLGDSKTQLYYLVGANVLNALLSYLFVVCLDYSLVSTAWASVISQLLAFVLLWIKIQRTNIYMKVRPLPKYFDLSYFKEIVRIGLPTGIQQSVVSLSQILILGLVSAFGTGVLAAYSAASRIESVAMIFVLNFSTALTTFVGQNFGAGEKLRVRKGLSFSLKMMLALSIVTFVVFFFGGKVLLGLFSDSEVVSSVGGSYLFIAGAFWFLFAVMNVFTSFFRGVGFTFVPMVVSVAVLLVVRLPLSYVLSLSYGTDGIWYGAPLSWFIGVVIYLVCYVKSHWERRKPLKAVLSVLVVLCFLGGGKVMSQDFCSDYLSPLNIKLSSSGHFGELRTNHFHSGIDLRTAGKENQVVICPYDGEVSRIKVQVYGGGKNLYINHTNGYTTVYMHLNDYYGKIGEYVKNYQYSHKCYAFDHTLPKGTIKLKKGDTIALSGNTGSSGGPHLHYEIRNTASQITINPILKGLNLQDTIAPRLYAFRLLAADCYSHIENCMEEDLLVNLSSDTCFKSGDTICASGNFYLCIEAYDRSCGSTERNGVYDTRVYVDDELLFRFNNASFSFDNSRYANAIIDYAYLQRTGRRMLWTKQFPSFKLNSLSYSDKGVISVENNSFKRVRIFLCDEKDNRQEFEFVLRGSLQNPNIQLINSLNLLQNQSGEKKETYPLLWNKINEITFADMSSLTTKVKSIYEDTDIEYSARQGKYSMVHTIGDKSVPIHKAVTLRIRYKDALIPFKNKALVVSHGKNGTKASVGGKVVGRDVVCSISNFGTYSVEIDTIAPRCKPHNFNANKPLKSNRSTVEVKISDNLSGISTYNAYIDDKWVLAEYDGKSGRLIIKASEFTKGRHNLQIRLTDAKANSSIFNYVIIR